MTTPSAPAQARALLQVVAVTVVGVLPAFLVGALAVEMRREFAFGPARLGIATTVLFAITGLLSAVMGRVVQRLGPGQGIAIAAMLSAVSLAGVGVATSFGVLLLALAVGGVANALAPPAANLSLSRGFASDNLGLAFGIKQSSIPIATFLCGLAVPVVALHVGWRWAVAGAAGCAAGISIHAFRQHAGTRAGPAARPEAPDRGLPRRGLLVLTLGGGLGAAAATSLGVFFVDSAVRAGLDAATAGLCFAACSLLGLVGRVALGWGIDRSPNRSAYVLIANLLVLGALGYVLLGDGRQEALVAGSLLAYGGGWTWTGLFHFAIVKANRRSAASSTGFVQTGLSLGSAAGPLAFGVVADVATYRAAWLGTGLVTLLAAVAVRVGRGLLGEGRVGAE